MYMIRRENNPLQAMKTSFLESGHNGFFVKGLTCDFRQKEEIGLSSFIVKKGSRKEVWWY